MVSAVSLENVTVSYGKQPAIYNLTVDIPLRQVTAVVGPNGSGKTTFLKALLGLLPLQSGSIQVMGKPFDRVREVVAYVPQKEEIDWNFPLLVWEVVALGRCAPGKLLRRLTKRDRLVVDEALRSLDLTRHAWSPLGQLSGGQKQRVFLARALAREAELYLLDEPFNGVDISTEKVIKEHLLSLKEKGKTVILVHHKLDEVYRDFDWALLLNRELISFGPTRMVLNQVALDKTYRRQGVPFKAGAVEGEEPWLNLSGSW